MPRPRGTTRTSSRRRPIFEFHLRDAADTSVDGECFRNPPARFRGAPFWGWNNRLDIPQLLRQIDHLKAMGFGGFHIHARTGLDTPYLGDEFMAAVKACAAKAAAESMLCWLYDEDRWPSGFAGGLVTREEKFRSRHLLWTANLQPALTPLATYAVQLKDGCLADYRRLKPGERPPRSARVWHAYLRTAAPDSWHNDQTYVDVFNPAALARFIELTHERYASAVGEHFGTVVPAIFTDEPQFTKKQFFRTANEARDLLLPFTDDFPETYRAAYKQDLLDHLPELFWNLPDGESSLARYRYHDHTAERFASAFGDTIGRWCERHAIALTGHLLGEVNLTQTRGVGECMRALRSFHIPGIDILCDRMELTTAKQAQSIAHQFGRSGVLSELYGVTNWDFDFVGHKAQGDWQAAMGVTVRVPHLAWVSMAGEAKRDYPASIGPQSPWYAEYPLIEDHFGRVNTVLTRGRPHVRVGVIHPIESYWFSFGSMEQNQPEMQDREEAFRELPSWLLFGLIDFDYISESLLPTQAGGSERDAKRFMVGEMAYDAVLVPSLRTIRATTLQRLERFANAGGAVIFAGEIPSLVDGNRSPAAQKLAARCTQVGWRRRDILAALSPFRDVEIYHGDGVRADSILHQRRDDGKHVYLFFCNTDREFGRGHARIRVRGKWDVDQLDSMTGRTRPLYSTIDVGDTVIPWSFTPHGHLLIRLSRRTGRSVRAVAEPKLVEIGRIEGPVPVTLSEPNVLMLDQAEWRLNDGEWNAAEEVLRIDDCVRQSLNLPLRGGRMAQPWVDQSEAPVVALLQLRFSIRSEVTVDQPSLAIEAPETVKIHFDADEVSNRPTGWWIDESIATVALPALAADVHELLLTIPFTRKTNLEWCYLLGDFGVAIAGRSARIIAPVRELAFGDWTRQGLPFYAGNVTYRCVIDGDDRDLTLAVPKFRAPLLSVNVDDKPAGKIAFAPFELTIGRSRQRRSLEITAFGNRVNTFGAVHNANEKLNWFGPAAWRQTGASWACEYQLRRMGVLAAPILRVVRRT